MPIQDSLSRIVRKPDFCLCKNKGADQLRSKCEADQRLCFRYTDSTIHLPLKSEISSFYPASVTVQAGLCQTWSETPKTGFLASRLLWQSRHRKKAPYTIHCSGNLVVATLWSTLHIISPELA